MYLIEETAALNVLNNIATENYGLWQSVAWNHISYEGKAILVFVESYQAMKVGGHPCQS